MAALKQGSAALRSDVLALATELAQRLPEDARVLAGIRLACARAGHPIAVELVVLTPGAAFVGIDANRAEGTDVAPQEVAWVLADVLKRSRLLPQPLPIYAFGLGEAAPEAQVPGVPVFADAASLGQYILAAAAGETSLPGDVAASLAAELLRQDANLKGQAPLRRLQAALSDLASLPGRIDAGLQDQIRQPFLWRQSGPILPADVSRHLEKAMLRRENLLEDADYGQVVPNEYTVEISEENYHRRYLPIEAQVCSRWQAHLLESLDTANRRWGRARYRFGGGVRVTVQPVAELAEGQVRIHCRIQPDLQAGPPAVTAARLETLNQDRQWLLHQGRTTIGRDQSCDICLDLPAIQQARLVSSQHAYIVQENGVYTLYDGAPGGKLSTNGTFLNGQRVEPSGRVLRDGDLVILATLEPSRPSPDTPGVAALRFRI